MSHFSTTIFTIIIYIFIIAVVIVITTTITTITITCVRPKAIFNTSIQSRFMCVCSVVLGHSIPAML